MKYQLSRLKIVVLSMCQPATKPQVKKLLTMNSLWYDTLIDELIKYKNIYHKLLIWHYGFSVKEAWVLNDPSSRITLKIHLNFKLKNRDQSNSFIRAHALEEAKKKDLF